MRFKCGSGLCTITVIPGAEPKRGSPEPMNTGLWNMGSRRLRRRPGMTTCCAFLCKTVAPTTPVLAANSLQKQPNIATTMMPPRRGLLRACKFPANAGEQLRHTQRA